MHKKNMKATQPRFIKVYRRRKISKENKNFLTSSEQTPLLTFSMIHGLRHITEKNIHPLERFVWISAVIVALLGIVFVNQSAWRRFQENPVVISIERDYKLWNTSFPALTLCPSNKIDQEAVKLLTQKYQSKLKEDFGNFIYKLTEATLQNLDIVPEMHLISPENYIDLILNSSFNFQYDLITSNLNVYKNQSLWMTKIFSEKGVCYTFASKIAKFQDYKYKGMSRNSIHSIPSLVGNPLEGDVIVQIVNMNTGGSIQIHNDREVADVTTKSTTAVDLYFKTIEVTAHTTVSSPEISSLRREQRKCQFLEEDTLSLRPIYTYNLCRMDCRMKLSQKLCRCVPHFYWGLKDKVHKLCDITGLRCLALHKEKLLKLQVNGKGESGCICFPPCDDTSYQIDVDDSMRWFRGTNLRWGIIKYPKLRFKREILFGITDLLVATGGSVGLFLGCSVLSFIEIIFCIVQPVFRRMGMYLQSITTKQKPQKN